VGEGSIFGALQVVTSLNRIAAVRPPPSLPANGEFRRPMATGVTARSLALLSISRNSSSAYQFNAAQFDRA
jgi:hypothetical protein